MSGLLAVAETHQNPSPRELRVSERFACDVPASCQPPSDWKRGGHKWTARLRDISAGGLCLILSRRFERGAGLAIEVPGVDADSQSTMLARVVHVRAEGGGLWALGCSFVSPLSDEELATLTRFAPSNAVKNAVAPSNHLSVSNVFFRATLPQGGVVQRFIRKLNGAWPLTAGRTVGVRFHGGPLARVRVEGCRTAGDRLVLDCTFVGAPPAELLHPAPKSQRGS
jgi:PilZ domain